MSDEHSDPADCGCGPRSRERATLWPTVSRRGAFAVGAVTLLALGAAAAPLVPAWAADYPSWDDVEAAKANEAAKAIEITNIQNLIATLQSEVVRTSAIAEQKANEFYDAQQAYFEAAWRADQLQAQADAESAKAIEAVNEAGRVAAQLYRNGGEDTPLQLFFAGSAATADDLLARLGTMDKMLERNQTVYSGAVAARDSAKSLTDQAAVQRTERDRLQQVAEAAMVASQEAADAAQAALDAQNTHLVELQAQLTALQDTTAKTVAEYQAGVEAERQRQAELERQREAERQRLRDEAAANAAANNSGGGGGGGDGGGGGGGGGSSGGVAVASGWARPSYGGISSGYGWRDWSSSFHAGVDLASGCYSPIFAAASGTVQFVGASGGYGNYIAIDHGGGVGTGYGHIAPGGFYVSRGQWVEAGQQIAAEGNTGNSSGCHLHFEVYPPWGGTTDPVPWMADRGIWL